MAMPRFLVAKYVPDPQRMEPRNIGVVLWADGQVRARFLGEQESEHSEIRSPRGLRVHDVNVYRDWVHYWRQELEKPALTTQRGDRVSREHSQFVDALATRSKLQYMLVDAGTLLEQVAPDELEDVVSELFETLVLEKPQQEEQHSGESALLRRSIREVLAESRLKERPDFHENAQWPFRVKGVRRLLKLDYVFQEPSLDRPPTAVMQRVLLSRQASVTSTAFMFDHLVAENGLPRERCAALVYVASEDHRRPEIRNAIDLVQSYGTVVNLVDCQEAIARLVALAS